MSEQDAESRAVMPEQPPSVGGGTAEGRGFERQADTAHRENAGDETCVSVLLMNRRIRNRTYGGVRAGG